MLSPQAIAERMSLVEDSLLQRDMSRFEVVGRLRVRRMGLQAVEDIQDALSDFSAAFERRQNLAADMSQRDCLINEASNVQRRSPYLWGRALRTASMPELMLAKASVYDVALQAALAASAA